MARTGRAPAIEKRRLLASVRRETFQRHPQEVAREPPPKLTAGLETIPGRWPGKSLLRVVIKPAMVSCRPPLQQHLPCPNGRATLSMQDPPSHQVPVFPPKDRPAGASQGSQPDAKTLYCLAPRAMDRLQSAARAPKTGFAAMQRPLKFVGGDTT